MSRQYRHIHTEQNHYRNDGDSVESKTQPVTRSHFSRVEILMHALNQSHLDNRDLLAHYLHMVAVTSVVLNGDLAALKIDHNLNSYLPMLARDARVMGDCVKDLKVIK
jgi:hypothetical protein